MKRILITGLVVILTVVMAGCEGGSVDSMINSIDGDAQKMKQTAASGDQAGFLAAANSMASTMVKLKPKIEAMPESERAKYAPKLMTAMMSMMDDKVMKMVETIKSGPDASKWDAVEKKMDSLGN